MSAYPKDLIPILKRKWETLKKRRYGKPPSLPSRAELEALLDVAFNATLLTEEGRRPGFRIAILSPKEFEHDRERPESSRYANEARLLPFDEARPYTAAEVNRLAPAAELTRLIMCVANTSADKNSPDLRIWAMLDVGENWWRFIHNESSEGRPPPNHLTITSSSPGELSLSVQGDVLLTLKSGQIFHPARNALWSGPVSNFLESARRELYKEAMDSLNMSSWDAEGSDDDYPLRFYNYFLERILFYVRRRQHGGTLIIIPRQIAKDDTRLADRINIKYPCSYDHAWGIMVQTLANHRKYYDLHFPLWDGKKKPNKELFREYSLLAGERDELDEALGDAAQAIAALTAVDGAVIMTERFNVIGFGVELTAASPSLEEIVVVTRPRKRHVSIDSYGTRHRAAFRFCSSFENSAAFIVSSDGGVKAVKRVGRDVFLWPDINTGSMGL